MKNTILRKRIFPLTLAAIAVLAVQPSPAQQTPPALQPETTLYSEESAYAEYMRLGYAASQREDYRTAATYFRYALYYNPNDREATIAYWNARDAMNQREEGDKPAYDRYMEAGYDATEAGNFQTALENFNRALQERPGDYYATQATRNVQTYINRGEEAASGTVSTEPRFYPGEDPYDRYMRLGYAAVQRQDFRAAAQHFRSALYERPRDRQANIAFWNAAEAIKDGDYGLESETPESTYDRYMRIGYDATERGDYQTALINFRRAIAERPGDEYAAQAIRNVQTYINRGDGLSGN